MINMKRKITFFVMLVALVTLIPIGNVQAKSNSPAKLSAKDFTYNVDGKKNNFIKLAGSYPGYHYCLTEIIDKKNRLDNVANYRIDRKVKIGSAESYVKKQ